jgi:hypothetical protein
LKSAHFGHLLGYPACYYRPYQIIPSIRASIMDVANQTAVTTSKTASMPAQSSSNANVTKRYVQDAALIYRY